MIDETSEKMKRYDSMMIEMMKHYVTVNYKGLTEKSAVPIVMEKMIKVYEELRKDYLDEVIKKQNEN